jgi:hypothetical protein
MFTDLVENSGYIKNLNTIQLQSIKQGKHDLIRIKGTIVDKPATILIDGASTHNFISQQFIDRYQLHSYLTKDKGVIEMGDGSTIDSSSYGEFAYSINVFSSKTIFYIEPFFNRNNAILGKEWLYEQQFSIDWQQNIITLSDDKPNVRKLQILEFKANNKITFLRQKKLNQLINHR